MLGGTNYQGAILFTGEGMGPDVPPTLFIANPEEPYNTSSKQFTGILVSILY